jgi:glycine oxidase
MNQRTQHATRVVVAGGGVAGCAAAYYLSEAGARVTIVEREGIGNGASGWSAGGLNPLQGIAPPIWDFAMESFRLHLALWPELRRHSSQQLAAGRISMAYVAPDAAAVSDLKAQQSLYEQAEGFTARWVEADELRRLEPRLATHVAGALLTHGNGVLESHRLTVALSEAAQHFGAALLDGEVTGLVHRDGRVTGALVGDMTVPCDAVVVAMGPWSGVAEAWLGVPLPVEPLKGEIIRMRIDGPPLPFDVVTPAISLFARPGRHVWLASTQQRLGFDREPSAWGYQTLHEPAVALMPSLTEASLVQQTACLRPITPDDLPITGAVPGWQGAYIATAGSTKGILLGPGMGKAISDLILTGRTELSIGGMRPERFAAARR